MPTSARSAFPTVSGTIRFGDQKAEMSHVYVRRNAGADGVTTVVVSDHPLPLRALNEHQRLVELARKRAFVGFLAEIDSAGELRQGELFYEEGSFSGSWTFHADNKAGKGIAGTVEMDEEREFFGKPYQVKLGYEVSAKPTETWSGSAFYQTPPSGLALAQAKGWLSQNETKTELRHAFIITEADLFGDSGERTLLLTNKPVAEAVFQAANGMEQPLHDAGIVFLRVRIDAKGEIESLSTSSEDGGAMTFSSTEARLELVQGPDLDGSVALVDEDGSSSHFPRFQVMFHAEAKRTGAALPVTAQNGEPLPKDGGAPGKAYRQFNDALKAAATLEELLPLRIAAMKTTLMEIPAEHRPQMLAFLKSQAGTPLEIVGGFGNATQATLWLEGKQDGEQMKGRVNLYLEEGSWKLGTESYRVGTGT